MRSSRSTSSPGRTGRPPWPPSGGSPRQVAPLLLVSEIRAVAADQLWLSGAYGRDTLAIHFTWRNAPGQVDAVLPRGRGGAGAVRRPPALGQGLPRPRPASSAGLYPRLADARALFERLDPGGRFSNDRLERLGVRAPVS